MGGVREDEGFQRASMSEKVPEPGAASSLKEDNRTRRGWWAPGSYLNTCQKCGQNFVGDKRAGHCADCAYSDMSEGRECISCAKCGKNAEKIDGWFRLTVVSEASYAYYCSRVCLVEGVAPEVKQAIVVKQWVPTPEEEERMRQ